MGILFDIIPLLFSLGVGAYTTFAKHKAQDVYEIRMAELNAAESARTYETKHSSKSRKFIVHSMIGMVCLFPMLLTIMNWIGSFYNLPLIAIHVPQEINTGGLFSLLWSEETVKYDPIYGFTMTPMHFYMAQTVVGFYFGAAYSRR